MTISALSRARTLIRELTVQEKLYLLNDITTQIVQESSHNTLSARPDFPIFHVTEWPADMPQRREDLYDDRGR